MFKTRKIKNKNYLHLLNDIIVKSYYDDITIQISKFEFIFA